MQVVPLNFLQQNHVHLGLLKDLLDPMQHEIAIKAIEALVNVIS
jgi:hypothetical protein